MKYTNVQVPVITMDELTKLQNEYMFFDKILKNFQNKKKRLWKCRQWFRHLNCKEKMKPLEMMFDAIDQGKVLIND